MTFACLLVKVDDMNLLIYVKFLSLLGVTTCTVVINGMALIKK